MFSDLSPYYAELSDNPLENAFKDGRQAHPPSGQRTVPKDAHADALHTLEQTPRARPGMAYVHVPFCENHCLFCGFYQNAWRPEAGAPYVDLVLKQAQSLENKTVLQGPPLRALYFGGGTPTALSAPDISRLVTGLRGVLPLAPDCEITLEGRVHSFTEDKIEAAFAAGVNRISLGVQTFDTRIRKSLGRKAPKEKLIAALEHLVSCDSGAIVIDLMYGLPHQTHETWREDLALVDQIGLDGVDHYGLNLIPGTPLMSSIEKGKLSPITRKMLGDYYARGFNAMVEMGWHPISTSHWQSPSLRERSIYNFGAKTGWDFFGLGAGAGGSVNGIGTYNTPQLELYSKQVEAGEPPFMAMTKASPLAPLLNAIRSGMERARLDPTAIENGATNCGLDGEATVNTINVLLDQWQRAGLLTPTHRFHDLTLPGRFWQVQMTQRLTRLLNTLFLAPDKQGSDSWSAGASSTSSKHNRRPENVH